jgi:hypothetical protein
LRCRGAVGGGCQDVGGSEVRDARVEAESAGEGDGDICDGGGIEPDTGGGVPLEDDYAVGDGVLRVEELSAK